MGRHRGLRRSRAAPGHRGGNTLFGMLRPCRNRLSPQLRQAWLAHLCGMCLALRDRHGHLARLVTNYDGLVLSALVEAQQPQRPGARRQAGPCVLRGLRGAQVSQGAGAELAASASLLLASAQLRDHVDDGDLTGAVRARTATLVARRWERAGSSASTGLGLDVEVLQGAVARQGDLERALTASGPGDDPVAALLRVTAPTEEASAEGLRATAVVAGRPGNADALAEAGRLFGRVAHLLDAVEDLADDCAASRFNPVLATGLTPAQVRQVCDDAALGVRLALDDVELDDPALVHLLLVHELPRAVERTFRQVGFPSASQQPPALPPEWKPPRTPGGGHPGQQGPYGAPPPHQGGGYPPPPAGGGGGGGCLAGLVACGSCGACGGGSHGPARRGHRQQPRQAQQRRRDKDGCGDACDCCECCSCDC
jgi:hypothetical protein